VDSPPVVAAPVPAPSAAAAPAGAVAPEPAAAPGCRDGSDPDALLRARLAEIETLRGFELARLVAREGRILPWPDEPAFAPDAVTASVEAWAAERSLHIEALDCSEYPCLAWIAAPGSGEESRQALRAALEAGRGIEMSELPLRDGRRSAILAYGDLEARRDRRTRWRERGLRGEP
jgi:hypothetical protein